LLVIDIVIAIVIVVVIICCYYIIADIAVAIVAFIVAPVISVNKWFQYRRCLMPEC